jgi:hypothetical protein
MKNHLITLAFAIFTFSCGSPADKKIDIDNYPNDIEAIKAEGEYDSSDFAVLNFTLGMATIVGEERKEKPFDATYRELLDEIKKERMKRESRLNKIKQEYESAMQAYNDSMEKMRGYASIVVQSKTHEISEYGFGSLNLQYLVTNNHNEAIEGLKYAVIANDMFGDEINVYRFKSEDRIMPGEKKEYNFSYALNQYSSSDSQIADLDLDKITFEYEPYAIVLDGGELIEKPEEPIKPMELY